MKLITNTIGSFLTGDQLADAVLDYAAALTHRGMTDLVEFPFMTDDGDREHVRMMVGSRIELATVTRSRRHDDVVDEAVLDDLRQRTESMGVLRVSTSPRTDSDYEEWLDNL